ncbi:MAG: transcription antitermination factor NusB [Spirochaetaceae bacterium]|jgi:N utilization substance protein B|nr:transcription antitermination factor NusB [Spirochaetaceae bacterium]
MASRRKGRILAFQALYSWETSGVAAGEAFDLSWLEQDAREDLGIGGIADFSRLLVTGTIENIKAVDTMIRSHLKKWDFSRIKQVDLAVLRMSTYTLMYQTDMHPSIVIHEAIGISKEFGTDESHRFVNGVLDSIRKTLQNASASKD